MGVRFEDIANGALETGKLLVKGMEQWNQATGKGTSIATPPIVAAVPPGGGVSAQPQGQSATPAGGLAALPGWVIAAGALAALWYFGRRR